MICWSRRILIELLRVPSTYISCLDYEMPCGASILGGEYKLAGLGIALSHQIIAIILQWHLCFLTIDHSVKPLLLLQRNIPCVRLLVRWLWVSYKLMMDIRANEWRGSLPCWRFWYFDYITNIEAWRNLFKWRLKLKDLCGVPRFWLQSYSFNFSSCFEDIFSYQHLFKDCFFVKIRCILMAELQKLKVEQFSIHLLPLLPRLPSFQDGVDHRETYYSRLQTTLA